MTLKKTAYQQFNNSGGFGFAGWIFTLLLIICAQLTHFSAKAQCTGSTPSYTFDLTGHPDTTVSSPSIRRNGSCSSCGSNCVKLTITLDSKASGFIFSVSGGSGGTTYTFGCGTSSPVSGTVGSLRCVTGTGPYTITFCKPGSNLQTYSVQSVTNPYSKNDVVYLPKSCKAKLQVYGLVKSSITWASISGSAYNSNLSCTSGCDTPYVSYSTGFPSYVDYKVCGTPVNTCYGSSWCDTIRVYYDTPLSISVSPKTGKVCGAGKNTTIQSTVTGGLAPYTYSWKNGSTVVSTSSSLTASVGTYILSVKDSLGCTAYTDTAYIVADPSVVKANAGNDTTICASVNRVSLHGSVSFATSGKWTGGSGTYFPNDTTLIATYIPSQSEINAGVVNLTLTTTGISPCVNATDIKTITILPVPTPVVSGPSMGCANTGGYVYSTPNVSGDTYAWTVAGGTISSGQGTNSITVSWGSAGPGYLYVKETSASGCYEVSSLNPLSKFDFNTNPITHATTGPDGFYKDGEAYSEGMGATIMSGCGGSRGLDLAVAGATVERGKLCVDFRFQRDESDANFFVLGGLTFRMVGGVIYVQYYVDNTSGGYTVVGPTSTGYTVPNDDTYRSFSFCYDSASGVARAYVDGSQIWTNSTTAGKSLNWTTASSFNIGNIMDGNCSYRALLDYTNIGVPVSVVNPPTAPTFTLADTICSGTTVAYSVTANSSLKYNWGAPGGQIIGSNTSNAVTVQWVTVGTGTLVLTVTDKVTGCVTTSVKYTNVIAKPNTTKILH